MPRLWIFSDLHLETIPYPEAFDPPRPEFDILVAAGDIWEGKPDAAFRFLNRLAGDKPIVFVMGNHEYWNGEIGPRLAYAQRQADKYGIALLEGESELISGCYFVGTTLWSDYSLGGAPVDDCETGERVDVEHAGGRRMITPADSRRLHQCARGTLEDLLSERVRYPVVVVTHHAPHPDSLPAGARGSWMAGNSASDLSDLTDAGNVSLWVHGHIHESVDMTRPGGTRIVCNPAGTMFGNASFDEGLVIEVE